MLVGEPFMRLQILGGDPDDRRVQRRELIRAVARPRRSGVTSSYTRQSGNAAERPVRSGSLGQDAAPAAVGSRRVAAKTASSGAGGRVLRITIGYLPLYLLWVCKFGVPAGLGECGGRVVFVASL